MKTTSQRAIASTTHQWRPPSPIAHVVSCTANSSLLLALCCLCHCYSSNINTVVGDLWPVTHRGQRPIRWSRYLYFGQFLDFVWVGWFFSFFFVLEFSSILFHASTWKFSVYKNIILKNKSKGKPDEIRPLLSSLKSKKLMQGNF